MKYAALYIRVSTDTQFEEGYSIEVQKEMLEGFCKSKNIKQYEFYIDGGYSGSNIERPFLQKLIQDINDSKINYVVVYKLDRLSRSQKDTLYLIEDVFIPKDVAFVSLHEALDTSSPYGRAMIGILSAFAQLERENIRLRTRDGMKGRIREGYWKGGGKIPFGYDYDKEKGILIPNKDADTVKKVYDLYLQGYSPDKIAKTLNLAYPRLATQILIRKSNTGCIVYNNEEYIGQHDPIISLETYEHAMLEMEKRSNNKFAFSKNLLVGLIYCGKCGAKMRYINWGNGRGCKIGCYSQQKSKEYLIKDPNCNNKRQNAEDIEIIVIKHLFSAITKIPDKDNKIQISMLEAMEQQRLVLINKVKRLYNLYGENNNDLLLETILENQREITKLENDIKKEKDRNIISENAERIKNNLISMKDRWDYATYQEKQAIMRDVIEKIILTDDKMEILYRFRAI
jgi:site-specific DNA recombinase